MRTRAAVLRDPAAPFTVEEIDLDAPGPGELLVRIVGTGLCHTDISARRNHSEMLPAVLGHEGSGIVESVGPGVTRVRPGDHVVLSFDSCGWCLPCHSGLPSDCVEFRTRNLSGTRPDGTTGATTLDGVALSSRWFAQSSFAGHAVATERNTVVVDPALPLELLGPLGCGIQTGAGSILIGLGVRAGASVAVFGAGSVGLSAVMAAALTGASTIVAVDVHPKRRELALELGATHAFDGADPDLAATIKAATGGVDYSLDTTGIPQVIRAAIEALGQRGACGLVGTNGVNVDLPPALLAGRTLTFLREGNAVPQVFIPQLIAHWQAGRLPFDRLVRPYPLDAINEAEADSRSGHTIKPVLIP